jgi:hypothetical protein
MAEKTPLSKLLAAKFKKSEFATIRDWRRATNIALSDETLSKVVLRGIEPGVPAFIAMADSLGVPPDEIAAACKDAGDNVLSRLIARPDVDAEDLADLKLLAAIPAKKKKAARDMLKALGE